jgi:hypothetical protein
MNSSKLETIIMFWAFLRRLFFRPPMLSPPEALAAAMPITA